MSKTRVYVDGFLKYDGMINGCSVHVERDNKQLFFNRYLIEKIKNDKFHDWVIERPITSWVVEYFAIYRGLQIAEEFDADYLYSDAELIVKVMNEKYRVHTEAGKRWYSICKATWKGRAPELKILWISRDKMVEVLGH